MRRWGAWATGVAAGAALLATPVPSAAQDWEAILDPVVSRGLDDWNVAGVAVGVVQGDSLVLARGWGVEDVETGTPVTARSLFAIGSNSKLFTAVAMGMLVDEGRVGWDDPVVRHLPGFQLHDPFVTRDIRIRDLLSHRSGLGRRGDMLWYASPHDRDEIVRRIRFLEPNTSFRSAYGYQNVMFLTAGQVIAATEGRPWDDVVAERIFGPLGMARATTSVDDLPDADVADPHATDGGAPVRIPWRNIDNVAPAGSINASVEDMARWLRLLLGGGRFEGRELVDSATLREIATPHTILPVPPDTLRPQTHFVTYGLGVVAEDHRGVKVLWHTGGIDGMLSLVAWVPEADLGLVVLTNTAPNDLFTAVFYEVLDAALGAEVDRDWNAILRARARETAARATAAAQARADATPEVPSPVSPGAYAGTYRSELYGDVVVTAGSDGLRVAFGPHLTGGLEHHTATAFRAVFDDPAVDPMPVVFHLAHDGSVRSLELPGQGTFDRVASAEAGS